MVSLLDWPWKSIGRRSLWPTKSLCLPVLLCSALNSTDTNFRPTQTKASYFLSAQYAKLARGGIKETPDSVILSKVKLQRLGNGSAFPTGYDQRDFHFRNTGLTAPFQMRFKLGSCTLWYVFLLSSGCPMQPQTVSSDHLITETLFAAKITIDCTLIMTPVHQHYSNNEY